MKKRELIEKLVAFNLLMRSLENSKLPMDRVLTRKEFQQLIGVSRVTEWRMVQEGLVPEAVVINGKILGYSVQSFLKWIKVHSILYKCIKSYNPIERNQINI